MEPQGRGRGGFLHFTPELALCEDLDALCDLASEHCLLSVQPFSFSFLSGGCEQGGRCRVLREAGSSPARHLGRDGKKIVMGRCKGVGRRKRTEGERGQARGLLFASLQRLENE